MSRRTLGLVLVVLGALVFVGGCLALIGAILNGQPVQVVVQAVTICIGLGAIAFGFRTRRTAVR